MDLRLCRFGVLVGALSLATGSAGAQTITDKAARDDVVVVPAEDPVMSRAIARARETLPGFFDTTAQPQPGMSGFAVKVAMNIRRSQTLTVPRGAVTDWTYQSSGRMMGNYTACALASRASPQEAAEFQRQYRIDCSK